LTFFREMEKRGYINIKEVETAGKRDLLLKPTDKLLKEFNISDFLLERIAMIKDYVDKSLPMPGQIEIYEPGPSRIYDLIVSSVEDSMPEGVEKEVVCRLLEGVEDYALEEDSGFIICSSFLLLIALLGVRSSKIGRALNMLEVFEGKLMSSENNLFWSKVMIKAAEANILYGGRRIGRAEKIFKKLEGYPNFPLENKLLLRAKIASLKMLTDVNSCMEKFWETIQYVRKNYSSIGKGPYIKDRGLVLITLLDKIGDCMKMEGGSPLQTLYFDFFNFLKNRLKGEKLYKLYRSLGSLLVKNRYTFSNPNLVEAVFKFWNKEVDNLEQRAASSKYSGLDMFKYVSEFIYPALLYFSETKPELIEQMLQVDTSRLGINMDAPSNIIEMLIVELCRGNRKVDLEKLFMALERFVKEKKSSRGTKKREWLPPENVIFSLRDLILACDSLGKMDVLEEIEKRVSGYPSSFEKLIILADIAYAYALHGVGKYKQVVLEIVESTEQMVKKIRAPLYPYELNLQQLTKLTKITVVVDTLGKILAVTMNPDIVEPIVELCSNIPPHYDYFSIRYLLEAMIWQIKSKKQGIEYSRCTEYD
ncbi:MAG: hypothetical protein KIH10_17180, partial [Candidatus Freyarchaeota archaeon]|nr:hypothetical protein [Candidatus Jordarchaeia archaeon]